MTRKEIEKRCREEMQQNIPDREALWQRIESGLPEQSGLQVKKPKIYMRTMHRVMTAVACFLLVIGGLQVWNNRKGMKTESDNYHQMDNISDESDADADCDADSSVKTDIIKRLHYEDLAVPDNHEIRNTVDLSRLGVTDMYFQETDVLAKTELFVDVKVLNGFQDEETGAMQYILSVIDVYGGHLDEQELIIITDSAYILEQNHEYVLPVYQSDSGWKLTYESAPQIEKTLDHQLILHNGWQSVINADTEFTPVVYDSYGKDDYFYDRMYLTGDTAIAILVQKWQSM